MRKWRRSCDSQPIGKRLLWQRLRSDSRGNTLAMAAAAMVPIAGMIGSGLDMSRAYMAQAKLQNACDAGVLAGRREMLGTAWTTDAAGEAQRFFDFNFPSTTMNAQNLSFTITQDATDLAQVNGVASADIPTTVMSLFGNESIPINVTCNAKQDYGNNDIMLVLDVTGSMNSAPSSGGSSKISMLRTAAVELYRTLEGATNTRTRYGIIPYSMSVNVARRLRTRDILRETYYLQCSSGFPWDCDNDETVLTAVHIDDSQWASVGNTTNQNIRDFRLSGDGCIEERPSIGNSDQPIEISNAISQADIDNRAANANDRALQYGRYDPDQQHSSTYNVCPAEATKLRTYNNETGFQNAIDAATTTVTGNTYHDLGMMWGARFLSQTGIFAANNPSVYNDVPVAMHIVFLTDGEMCPNDSGYTSFSVDRYDERMTDSAASVSGCGPDSLRGKHIARFQSACNTAKSMGMTIWVIAFDVLDSDEIRPCATSSGHFYESDGTDLQSVFQQIGQGIGELRLTQ